MSNSATMTDELRRDSEGNEVNAESHSPAEVEDKAITQEDLRNIPGAKGEPDEMPNEAEPAKPRIGYRVEYRNRWTDDLLSYRTHDGDVAFDIRQTDDPIFEVVTSYRVLPDTSIDQAVSSLALPTNCLRIHSIALINAIQSVVRYYPGQDLSGQYITVPWPYPVLVHHYDELQQFRQDCLSKAKDQLCIREKDAATHLHILLEYLDQEVMKYVREEQERNKKGFQTFDWMWVAHRPGTIVLEKIAPNTHWEARVVYSVSGGTLVNPPAYWNVSSWTLDLCGRVVCRVSEGDALWHKYDGERKLADNIGEIKYIDPTTCDQLLNDDEVTRELIRGGESFVGMIKPKCYQHRKEGADLSPSGVSPLQVSSGCVQSFSYINFIDGRPGNGRL